MRKDRKLVRVPARRRVRSKVQGSESRPRVAAFRSLRHFYLQAIDDTTGKTLAHVTSRDGELAAKLGKCSSGSVKASEFVGELMAQRLKDKGIEGIVFDRGGFVYHGRIKAAAEAMRKAGIKF